MVQQILSRYTASISDFQQNPLEALDNANGETLAVLSQDKPAFYCIPSSLYEQLLEMLDDQVLIQLAEERMNDPKIKISIQDLRSRVKNNGL